MSAGGRQREREREEKRERERERKRARERKRERRAGIKRERKWRSTWTWSAAVVTCSTLSSKLSESKYTLLADLEIVLEISRAASS